MNGAERENPSWIDWTIEISPSIRWVWHCWFPARMSRSRVSHPISISPMHSYAFICTKYSKICKTCEHESYMQNMQKYALHEIYRSVSSGVTVAVYQLRDPKGWVTALSGCQLVVPAPSRWLCWHPSLCGILVMDTLTQWLCITWIAVIITGNLSQNQLSAPSGPGLAARARALGWGHSLLQLYYRDHDCSGTTHGPRPRPLSFT